MQNKKFFSALIITASVFIFSFSPGQKGGCNSNSAKNKPAEAGVQFIENDWAKALAEAKKQKKPIFVDAYTTWCGPCRMLKQNTFSNKEAGDYFNKHFINVALDMEKGDGIAFSQKYGIAAYPTLLIMDPDQKSVSVSEGYINAGQLIQFGKYTIEKMPKIN